MVECEFCEEEFDSESKLHIHWIDEHEEDLNSHQREKAKRAKREKEESQKVRNQRLKKYGIIGGGVALIAVFAVALAPAVLEFMGGPDVTEEELELDRQPVKGDPDAETWVVEFGDYLCPVCQDFEQTVMPQIEPMIEDGDIAFYYMDLNLPQFEPSNRQASLAAQCVLEQDQDEFWDFHEALYENLGAINYDQDGLVELAEDNTEGLDYEDLEDCLENERTAENVDQDNQIAASIGADSTPTVLVNGTFVQWNQLPEILE